MKTIISIFAAYLLGAATVLITIWLLAAKMGPIAVEVGCQWDVAAEHASVTNIQTPANPGE